MTVWRAGKERRYSEVLWTYPRRDQRFIQTWDDQVIMRCGPVWDLVWIPRFYHCEIGGVFGMSEHVLLPATRCTNYQWVKMTAWRAPNGNMSRSGIQAVRFRERQYSSACLPQEIAMNLSSSSIAAMEYGVVARLNECEHNDKHSWFLGLSSSEGSIKMLHYE